MILSASDFAAFCAVAEAADSLLTHMPSEGWDQQEYGRIYEVKKVDPLLGLLNNVLDKLRRD